MIIRYNCPQASSEGAYMLLDLDTRIGVGYYSDGQQRWAAPPITEIEERTNVLSGVWVRADPPDHRLPEGF